MYAKSKDFANEISKFCIKKSPVKEFRETVKIMAQKHAFNNSGRAKTPQVNPFVCKRHPILQHFTRFCYSMDLS